MGRSKDEIMSRYGGMRFNETDEQRVARFAEIDELELQFKTGKVTLSDVEKIQRRLCDLKGIPFDDDFNESDEFLD